MDTISKKKRSALMSHIRGRRNKSTELVLASLLRKHKFPGWRRHAPLPGSPDFIYGRQKVAIFVDGCFWHGCPRHYVAPKANVGFWRRKVTRNRSRDRRVTRKLHREKWKVIRFWEHDLKRPEKVINKINLALS